MQPRRFLGISLLQTSQQEVHSGEIAPREHKRLPADLFKGKLVLTAYEEDKQNDSESMSLDSVSDVNFTENSYSPTAVFKCQKYYTQDIFETSSK